MARSAAYGKAPTPALARPFVKWAGGKAQLLPELLKYVPERFGTYHEPFVGGGALFWWLAASGRLGRAVISDTSESLIKSYRAVRDRVDDLVTQLSSLANDPVVFQRMREGHPKTMDDLETAVWFIYLNKTSYGGLYRVNKQGRYNTPFGKYPPTKLICDESTLRACSRVLNDQVAVRADIGCGTGATFRAYSIQHDSYEIVGATAKEGDLAYLDPPYPPVSKTANFVSYTEQGFPWAEQEKLRDLAIALKRRGVHVILSNSDQERVRELYADPRFTIHAVRASRAINSKVTARGPVGELVIT